MNSIVAPLQPEGPPQANPPSLVPTLVGLVPRVGLPLLATVASTGPLAPLGIALAGAGGEALGQIAERLTSRLLGLPEPDLSVAESVARTALGAAQGLVPGQAVGRLARGALSAAIGAAQAATPALSGRPVGALEPLLGAAVGGALGVGARPLAAPPPSLLDATARVERLLQQAGLPRTLPELKQVTEGLSKALGQPITLQDLTGASDQFIERILTQADATVAQFAKLARPLSRVQLPGADEGIISQVLRARLSFMTAGLTTAIRNTIGTGARAVTQIIDSAIAGTLGSAEELGASKALAAAFARPFTATRDFEPVDRVLPGLAARLLRFAGGAPGASPTVVQRLRWLNLGLNEASENAGRKMTFMAFAQARARELGFDFNQLVAQAPQLLADPARHRVELLALNEAVQAAIQPARAVTFAEVPRDAFFRALDRFAQAHPGVTLVTPFPRFMASAFHFVTDHLGLPLVKAFGVDARMTADELRQAVAKATSGAAMLATGLALQRLGFVGDRPTELRIGGRSFDLRPFFPVMFWTQFAGTLLDPKKPIEDSALQDLIAMFLGQGRFVDEIPLATQLALGKGDLDSARNALAELAGDMLSAFTVPARPMRDALESVFGVERSIDTRMSTWTRVWGPIASNIPFAGALVGPSGIPPVVVPTSGRDIASTDPVRFAGVEVPAGLFRVLSGVTPVTRDEVARLLIDLDVDPFQVAPRVALASRPSERPAGAEAAARRINQLTRTLMGPYVAAYAAPWVPQIRQLAERDREAARVILLGRIALARQRAEQVARLQASESDRALVDAASPASTLPALLRRRVRATGLEGLATSLAEASEQ